MITVMLYEGPDDEVGRDLRLPFTEPPPVIEQQRENRLAEYAYTGEVDHGAHVYELASALEFGELPS